MKSLKLKVSWVGSYCSLSIAILVGSIGITLKNLCRQLDLLNLLLNKISLQKVWKCDNLWKKGPFEILKQKLLKSVHTHNKVNQVNFYDENQNRCFFLYIKV